MAFFLGIDGGGTKTSCLIGDEHSVLGSGSGSGSNVVRVGETKVRESLTTAVRQACDAARIAPANVQRTFAGMAGIVQPEIGKTIRRMLMDFGLREVEVAGDMVIAMEAALGGDVGVIIIAGTGSVAYGQNAKGQTARAGGWGFQVSDEGSGYWIGRTAVASILRACDEEDSLRLLDSITQAWGIASRDDLVLMANRMPPPDFAGLFPHVVTAAQAGDPLAQEVLIRAGHELAGLAASVIQRLFPGGQSVRVGMSGGVFAHCSLVRQVFYNVLRGKYPNATINEEVAEPVQGALALARKGHNARIAAKI